MKSIQFLMIFPSWSAVEFQMYKLLGCCLYRMFAISRLFSVKFVSSIVSYTQSICVQKPTFALKLPMTSCPCKSRGFPYCVIQFLDFLIWFIAGWRHTLILCCNFCIVYSFRSITFSRKGTCFSQISMAISDYCLLGNKGNLCLFFSWSKPSDHVTLIHDNWV